jgi:hypothetical protein
VAFEPGWGAPHTATFDELHSWSEDDDQGIRRFSGTATYATTFRLASGALKPGARLDLDLGEVEVMARVTLNGEDLGLLWVAPYVVDITDAAEVGENELVVEVTNLWPNRMIGDQHLPEDSDRNPNGTLKTWPEWLQDGEPSPTGRYTFTTWRLWDADDPLQPSGLIGPVRVVQVAASQLQPMPTTHTR